MTPTTSDGRNHDHALAVSTAGAMAVATPERPGSPTHPEQYRERLIRAAGRFAAQHGFPPTQTQLLTLVTIEEPIALRHIRFLRKAGRLTLSK